MPSKGIKKKSSKNTPFKIIKKNDVSFGELFSKSWAEYKDNFHTILKFMLVFMGIPALLIYLIDKALIFSNPKLLNTVLIAQESATKGVLPSFPPYYLILSIVMGVLAFFFYLFVEASITSSSISSKRFSLSSLKNSGKKRYAQFILLNIVFFIFVFLLTLLLIIPGIIFLFYWLFATYIFYDEKENILPSLKKSRFLVKGRWWKVFGYSLLLFLICIGIFVVLALVFLLLGYIIGLIAKLFINSYPASSSHFIIKSIIDTIQSFIMNLIWIPLSTLFFKNFYVFLKENRIK